MCKDSQLPAVHMHYAGLILSSKFSLLLRNNYFCKDYWLFYT